MKLRTCCRAVGLTVTVCLAVAGSVGACEKELQKLNFLPPGGFLDRRLIANYRSIVPQVSAEISVDMQTAASGQTNLSGIAKEVDNVYRSAR